MDLDCGENSAVINNDDWFKEMGFLESLDIGKHITVNYMMAKDSVKNRPETGISYRIHLPASSRLRLFTTYEKHGCKIQMGGSDQW